MSRQEQEPKFQRAFLGGLLHLEQFMRALENPQLKVPRRTALIGAGGGLGLVLLTGAGVLLSRQAPLETSKKEEPEVILDPDQEIFNERLGLVFSNATKRPIAFFPQRLGDFLAEEQLTLPLPITIGFLLKDDSQPQTIKRANFTFYFNLQDPAHQNSDLELVLSAHIFTLLYFFSKAKTEDISQNAVANGFGLVDSPETDKFYQRIKTGQLQALFTFQR